MLPNHLYSQNTDIFMDKHWGKIHFFQQFPWEYGKISLLKDSSLTEGIIISIMQHSGFFYMLKSVVYFIVRHSGCQLKSKTCTINFPH